MRTFNLFISHSWKYENSYQLFVSLLNSRSHFDYKNYSVPPENPILGVRTDKALEVAIENKMRPCSIVIIMAGVYATYSKSGKDHEDFIVIAPLVLSFSSRL